MKMNEHEWRTTRMENTILKARLEHIGDLTGIAGVDNMTTEECVAELKKENEWMRREVERVGTALYTSEQGYVGTEEDLHAIGQTVEGVCDALVD